MADDHRTPASRRWPRWVYDDAQDEPDYRFSFANERTFLAWIRTALALLAGGVAVDVVDLSLGGGWQVLLAAVLVVLGLGCAVAAWLRWALAERAVRRREPLPSPGYAVVLTGGLLLAGAVVLLAFAVEVGAG